MTATKTDAGLPAEVTDRDARAETATNVEPGFLPLNIVVAIASLKATHLSFHESGKAAIITYWFVVPAASGVPSGGVFDCVGSC